ncbi:aromatic ring-hydroxylating dioxygenase subunit alpha [Microbacterium sp. LRZ72]|uniref:aromatic ring-hydroxylating oxygenase subunit alpha n=1 Tax=Microbacterium sp. LRZ72 TaxID=2942481 RepID=UPI0029A6AFC5|nr:aromatic ring-hydroxylating dioxygenase subunit alpha [Microbacterium sp. LRZ72]MDX2377655.1 aromatic ring-hydroxylating dioxygenase subunit alpha [Microbacterium sp. LRZ72]
MNTNSTSSFATGDLGAITTEIDQLVTPEHVHRRLYTDEEIFRREMGTVFGGSWTYVGHESEIPDPNSYVRRNLGQRPVMLTRSKDGEINVVLNRCSHRGTLLVTEERGCEAVVTCPYHGWRFGIDGKLKNVPVPSSYEDVRSGRFDLGRAHTENYRGFVFASLAPEPPSIIEWLGAARPWLDEYIDRYPGGQIAIHSTPLRYEFRANWKVSWDNAADGIHATFAHRSYNLLGKEAETETVLARNPAATPIISRAYPFGHSVVDQRPSIPGGPWSTMRPMPLVEELVDSLGRRGLADSATLDLGTGSMVNLNLFPNLIFVGNQLMVVEPIAVDHTRLSIYLLSAPTAPEETDLIRLRVDEDFVSFGTPDDFEMFERIQQGLSIPESEWIDTSRGAALDTEDPDEVGVLMGDVATEAPIRGYLKEWTRLMTAPDALATAPAKRPAETK